ncbi:hypothetical protein GGX14DRAFT_393929 [Mycena pura]|uniref:Uncharacterized protein n=1 Tax=Mycena pura TaxID=153505 RepID=A0AAD6VJ80_9AGAR|nr:hypothetical protein GGX14DRAFT_393929 [Mycena pura]
MNVPTPPLIQAFSGAIGSASANALTYPLDLVTTCLQLDSQDKAKKSVARFTFSAVSSVSPSYSHDQLFQSTPLFTNELAGDLCKIQSSFEHFNYAKVPFTLIEGLSAGPTVLITAGVHGAENCGDANMKPDDLKVPTTSMRESVSISHSTSVVKPPGYDAPVDGTWCPGHVEPGDNIGDITDDSGNVAGIASHVKNRILYTRIPIPS